MLFRMQKQPQFFFCEKIFKNKINQTVCSPDPIIPNKEFLELKFMFLQIFIAKYYN